MNVTPFLMFTGDAEAALRTYVSVVPNSRIEVLELYGPGDAAGTEGKVKRALVSLAGTTVRAFDSPPVHAFTFTPSISLFVDVDERAELERLATALSDGGMTLMPLGEYGFSRAFAWVQDRWGVSWQLNLP